MRHPVYQVRTILQNRMSSLQCIWCCRAIPKGRVQSRFRAQSGLVSAVHLFSARRDLCAVVPEVTGDLSSAGLGNVVELMVQHTDGRGQISNATLDLVCSCSSQRRGTFWWKSQNRCGTPSYCSAEVADTSRFLDIFKSSESTQ